MMKGGVYATERSWVNPERLSSLNGYAGYFSMHVSSGRGRELAIKR